jgi:hypothetical protein
MLRPSQSTNDAQNSGAHAEQQKRQGPNSPGFAKRGTRARLLVIRARREPILLGREPAQPHGPVGGPGRAEAIAEGHGQDGNPQRDVADDPETLGAKLSQRGYLRSKSVSG